MHSKVYFIGGPSDVTVKAFPGSPPSYIETIELESLPPEYFHSVPVFSLPVGRRHLYRTSRVGSEGGREIFVAIHEGLQK